jgi:hypothetical protein
VYPLRPPPHPPPQVVAALQDLYDRHKASYGWADRPLVIE